MSVRLGSRRCGSGGQPWLRGASELNVVSSALVIISPPSLARPDPSLNALHPRSLDAE